MKLFQRTRSLYKSWRPLVLVVLFCVTFLLSSNPVLATSIQFTTGSDWDSGTKTQVDTSVLEGQVELDSTGSWGARSWKSPDLPLSVGSAFASDGTDIYAARGYGDVRF